MEVVVPVPVPVPMAENFHFDSTSTPPFVSAHSSPTALTSFPSYHKYASAPTSPCSAFIPFDWESKPGTPKHHRNSLITIERGDSDSDDGEDLDFAFEFGGHAVPRGISAATADELFEAGKIRPLKPPPRLQQVSSGLSAESSLVAFPKSPPSPISCLLRRGKKEGEEFDPFAKAIEETTGGRERDRWLRGSGGSRKATRSASPLRAVLLDCAAPSSSSRTSTTPKGSSGGSRGKKWRLKDLLLFRSASEGRAMGGGSKGMLGKYRVLSEESGGGSSRGRRGEGGWVSGHYTMKRAVSTETKKKTFLPYRTGLLGCLGFNPEMHGVVKAFGSFVRGRS